MSESTAPLTPLWQDYLELTKPRVVALMIITALIGMCREPRLRRTFP